MRAVLIAGAGAVGRGFIAPMFAENNAIYFLEPDPVLLRSNTAEYDVVMRADLAREVRGAVAIHPHSLYALRNWPSIAAVFVCVGQENLDECAWQLAPFLRLHPDLPVVVVENVPRADAIVLSRLGFEHPVMPAIADCIIPEPNSERAAPWHTYGDANGKLVVARSHYRYLQRFLDCPEQLVPTDSWELDWDCKWLLHCALHAVLGWLGVQAGITYVWEAWSDREIQMCVRNIAHEVAAYLENKYHDTAVYGRALLEFAAFARAFPPDRCERLVRNWRRKCLPGERLDDLRQVVRSPSVQKLLDQILAEGRNE